MAGIEQKELFEQKDPEAEKVETPVEAKTEAKVEKQTDSTDDAAEQLKRQMEELRAGEAAAREQAIKAAADRDAAIRRANEREIQLGSAATQSRYDAINSAIAAASAAADTAQRDIEAAITSTDVAAQAEAYRRLAQAEGDLARLRDGKVALEEGYKAQQAQLAQAAQQQQQPQRQVDPLENANIPDTAKLWLKLHPEYMTDQRKNAKIQALHYDVIEEGHAPFSPDYFESLETHLGIREARNANGRESKRPTVSAPVSRDVPASNGTRNSGGLPRLSPQQAEAARNSGITELEYARNLQRLNELKQEGHYPG